MSGWQVWKHDTNQWRLIGESVYDIEESNEPTIKLDADQGQSLILRCMMYVPKGKEKDWLWTNVTRWVYNVIIDCELYENIVFQEVVNKLNLTAEKHPQQQKLLGSKRRNEAFISKHCHVDLLISDTYIESIWFDVTSMDACHIILVILGNIWLRGHAWWKEVHLHL